MADRADRPEPAPRAQMEPLYPPSYSSQQQAGYPPQQQAIPQQQAGYPPQQQAIPQQQAGYPPQQQAIPQQQAGYPPQQQASYTLQQQAGYPPQQQAGYPTQQQPSYSQEQQASYPIQQQADYLQQQTFYPSQPQPGVIQPAHAPQIAYTSPDVVVQQPTVTTTVSTRHYGSGDHGLLLSIIASCIVFWCCLWIGLFCTIPAIFVAISAQNAEQRGDTTTMESQKKLSVGLSVTGLITGFVCFLIYIIVGAAT